MKYSELKNKIGAQAKQIIISDLSLKSQNNQYSCCVTAHSKDNLSNKYYDSSNSFFCHDCDRWYDIIHHAQTKAEPYKYLMELAGEAYKPKLFPKLKPVTVKTTTKCIDFFKNRGITAETLELFKVRSTDSQIYFHYISPEQTLVKIKIRDINNKKFSAIKGGSEIFYGMHLLKGHRILVLCEGECDALALYQIVKDLGRDNEILCSSLPNGAGSLTGKCIENCKEWLDRFEEIYIIPDQDEAGKEFVAAAKERLSDYSLKIINLPVKDVNDYYLHPDYNTNEIFKNIKALVPDLVGIDVATDIEHAKVTNGIASGYLAHDHNDNGLKPRSVTVATGQTGGGKTTYVRQMPMACAMQRIKSFIFAGETSTGNELNKLARLCAEKGEIVAHSTTGGGTRYVPALQAIERFKKNYSQYILMTDVQTLNAKSGDKFKTLLAQMNNMARHHQVKLFVLDNLMILCEKQGNQVFSEQKDIVVSLKAFAEKHQVHVILIAHPKKGNGQEDISGATEIVNTCDTILRYVRISDENKKELIKKYPVITNILERASAFVLTEKVREDGHKRMSWLEWDTQRGALYDLSTLPMASVYENKGYWTRAINDQSPRYEP